VKIYFKTFGCRTNIYDTQLMGEVVEEAGHRVVSSPEEADVVVVNSCTVTNFADRDVRRYLRKLRRELGNGVKIIFTGCGAYTRGEEFLQNGLADLVIGHQWKEELPQFLSKTGLHLGKLEFVNRKIVSHFSTSKAFLKIQEGCDFSCGFCIIPAVRGPARSIPMGQILEQVKEIVNYGVQEIVLTGINMGSYGKEWGIKLSDLVEKVVQIRGVKRVRLGSLEPTQIDPKLEELLEGGVLEKHLHIALQHTSDKMLRLMKRRNRVKETLPLFQRLAEKGVALGTDFIVGHPGESGEIWKEAMENFRKYPLTHIHIFRYSPRSGTPSATLPHRVPGDIARKRGEELKRVVEENNYRFRLKHQKTPLLVHIEKVDASGGAGYDQFFNRCWVPGEVGVGEWVEVSQYRVQKEGNYAEREE